MFKKRNIASSAGGASSVKKKKKLLAVSSDESDSNSDSDSGNVAIVRNTISKFKRMKPNDEVNNKRQKQDQDNETSPITDKGEFKASGGTILSNSIDDATKRDTLTAEDEEAERNIREAEDSKLSDEVKNKGIYKGQSSYQEYFDLKKLTNRETKVAGPIKSNIRSTTVFDFLPDVCKDFKQTGYCGFGDTCKFLHLRDDMKKGWKISKEWESVGKSKVISDKKLEKIPFKCPICKEDYKNPIVTPCQHYFCQGCYLKEYKAKKRCFICHKNTGGSMVIAKDLQKIILESNKAEQE